MNRPGYSRGVTLSALTGRHPALERLENLDRQEPPGEYTRSVTGDRPQSD